MTQKKLLLPNDKHRAIQTIKPDQKTKSFRIHAKKLYLTYSQVHPSADQQAILQILKQKPELPFFNYVIAKEHHQDGGIHFHVLLLFNKQIDIKNQNALDIQFLEQTYHGNYQAARSTERVVEYVCKHGDYITSLENLVEGKLLSMKELLIKDVKDLGLSPALIKHTENLPEKALANVSLVSAKNHFQALQQLKDLEKADHVDTPFQLKDFLLTQDLKQWVDKPDKTLVLVGDSGVGKTAFCKAFVKEKRLKTLRVNHKQDFRRLDASYDAILIDDAGICGLSDTELLALVDNQEGKTIRVLYNSVLKKENLVQMLVMNNPEYQRIYSQLIQDRFARRVTFQQVKEPFINNLNVNIQINNIHFNEIKGQEEEQLKQTKQRMTEAYFNK